MILEFLLFSLLHTFPVFHPPHTKLISAKIPSSVPHMLGKYIQYMLARCCVTFLLYWLLYFLNKEENDLLGLGFLHYSPVY